MGKRNRNDYRTMTASDLYEEAVRGDKNTDYHELAIALAERVKRSGL